MRSGTEREKSGSQLANTSRIGSFKRPKTSPLLAACHKESRLDLLNKSAKISGNQFRKRVIIRPHPRTLLWGKAQSGLIFFIRPILGMRVVLTRYWWSRNIFCPSTSRSILDDLIWNHRSPYVRKAPSPLPSFSGMPYSG